jgi:hypothetical protein
MAYEVGFMAFWLPNSSPAFLRVAWFPVQTLISMVKLSLLEASGAEKARPAF